MAKSGTSGSAVESRPPLLPPDQPERRVYVNASLRLDSIGAVGFDMDYTLAAYSFTELESLAFGLAIDSLAVSGYPEAVRAVSYRPVHSIRGLVVDKDYGNVLKMDRYHHVSIARHGAWELDDEEKRLLYTNRRIDIGTDRFVSVDTLFSLPDVDLYCQLVVLRDADPDMFGGRTYRNLWDDVRAAVDLCHRDGRLKRGVSRDLPRFLEPDPELAPALSALRAQGKKLFLLTNSEHEFTDTVMSHLLGDGKDGATHWCGYFDDVVVEASKPRYFQEDPPPRVAARIQLPGGGERTIYAGGGVADLHARLGCRGDSVLFVGDHIYGDVIRSKKDEFWRTVMIVPELEGELASMQRSRRLVKRFLRLVDHLDEVDCQLATLVSRRECLRSEGRPESFPEIRRLTRALETAEAKSRKLQEQILETETRIDRSVHPEWGALMSDGGEVSRFGQQVQAYADLYTSRVTNLARYPAGKFFQSPWDVLPHHRIL